MSSSNTVSSITAREPTSPSDKGAAATAVSMVVSMMASMVSYLVPDVVARAAVALANTLVAAFDTLIYYIINGTVIILSLMELLLELADKVMYNYHIFLQFFKHEMYKNIN